MSNEIDWRTIEHKAKPRNERRMLVEVDVEPTGGIGEFGQFIQSGKSAILIYKSERAKLDRLTQTDKHRAGWGYAVEAYQQALAEHLKGIKDAQARELATRTFGLSPSSFYQDNNRGSTGVPPIRSYRILNDDVPAPETPENLQANQFSELTAQLARLITMGAQQPKPAR